MDSAWRPHPSTPPERLEWPAAELRPELSQILNWARHRTLPAVYSCNWEDIWPSTGLGHSSAWERDNRTGQNRLLDAIHRAALRSRPHGGRIDVMADGAYWTDSGRQFLEWSYVEPTSHSASQVALDQLIALLEQALGGPPRQHQPNSGAQARNPRSAEPRPSTSVRRVRTVLDIDEQIRSFVEARTEDYFDDLDEKGDPPERLPHGRQFLLEYIDGETLNDGTLLLLTDGYDTPAAKEIKRIAKDHWRTLEAWST